MLADVIGSLLPRVDAALMRKHLFHLAKDPLPCRTLNYTLPGHAKSTLHEADEFIAERLGSWGYRVEWEPARVQAFRRDEKKPLAHQYSAPDPADTWYTAYNLYAKKTGTRYPDEIIVLISHKDSQSWMVCTPGAYDNGIGTVSTLEIARVLTDYEPARTIWFVFCNEEHWPWTSALTARNVKDADLNLVAALNIDSLGGRSDEDVRSGKQHNVTRYVTPEGEHIADLIAELNGRYGIGLVQRKHRCETPNDDDGSFIKAGMPAAVAMVGSFPYAEPNYHLPSDVPENVDVENARNATQLCLATVLHLDTHGPIS